MVHEIHEQDRFGEVRSKGLRAWHGLGIEIPEGLTAQEGFEQIGLGWRTVLAPVFARMDGIGPNGPEVEEIDIPDRRAHIRADTRQVLGVVSDDYKPFENQDLARFADSLAGADAAVSIETGGTLYNGRRVFCCVKLPHEIRAAANDPVMLYVLVSNGHGGSASLSCYPTSVRVVCANTLRFSEQDLGRGLKYRHTGDFGEKVKQARVVLGLANKEAQKFEAQIKMLAHCVLSGSGLQNYFRDSYVGMFGEIDEKTLEPETVEKLRAKRNQILGRWHEMFEGEHQRIQGIQGTAWAAYNSVSEWVDHERGRFKDVTHSDARIASNIYGVAHNLKTRAYELALAKAR